jgi:glucokinase
VKAVAVTHRGKTLGTWNEAFDPDRQMRFGETIRAMIVDIQEALDNPASRIGLSAPGLASANGRSIALMPGRLAGLEGLDWSRYLKVPFDVPVLNDGHAALVGEVWLGAARGCRDAILLTLGTGVGGAAMVDGRLLKGHTGKAGHFGHATLDMDGPPDICNMPGSLEVAIGNCSIKERSGGRFKTTHELVAAHTSGDPQATQIWLRSVRALACAIGSFVNILDPEVCVIGGGIARAGAALIEPLKSLVCDFEWKTGKSGVRIALAELGELAGAYGAARNALDM